MRSVVIAVVLAAMGTACDNDEKMRQARRDALTIGSVAQTYCRKFQEWPSSPNAMAPPECSADHCMLEVASFDPWRRPFRFESARPSELVIESAGPDGEWSTQADNVAVTVEPLKGTTCGR